MSAVAIWIWFCAYLNCTGWALSAIHELNAAGYAVALTIWFLTLIIWSKIAHVQIQPRIRSRKLRHRFRKPFPIAFLILAAMAFVGGAIYAPNNYDALAYRIPRVLHWLAEGRWHWIHTDFPRLNVRAVGFEWLSAPLIVLMKTDRLLFLINIVSFLLLPGLIFSVFSRLGVRRRVAWYWMWILPTGYCFLLQAGSVANDMFPAVFALAALDFALRSQRSGGPRDFSMSILSAGLLIGGKASNLPLLLPWAVALWPSLNLIKQRSFRFAAVCTAALLSSLLPIAISNSKHCGDWSGAVLEITDLKPAPLLRLPVNAVSLLLQNFVPPVFPLSARWEKFAHDVVSSDLTSKLEKNFEPAPAHFALPELQIEEQAALGFGVSALLLLSVAAVLFQRRQTGPNLSRFQWMLLVSPYVALGAIMAMSPLAGIGRIIAPYYPLLIPILLVAPAHEHIVRRRWWRWLTAIVVLMAGLLVVISPARPLWPVNFFLERVRAENFKNPRIARLRNVYSVYQRRSDAFAPARAALPPDLRILGVVTVDDPETSLWRPFGTGRIEHVRSVDTPADLKARGIEYVLVKTDEFESRFACSPDDWIKRMNAEVIRVIPLDLRASVGPRDWYLVKFQEPP